MEKLREIAEKLVNLTILEARELGRILKEEHGISPSIQKQYLGYVPTNEPAKVIEQTEFDVIFKSMGSASKLNVVKLVKELTSLGLIESKQLVESAPAKVKEKISKAEAEEVRNLFVQIGAEIEVI